MNTTCTKIVRESYRLAALSDDQFAQQFLPFTEMAECLFSFEERQMEDTDFPFLKSHREQHAMVLRSLYRVAPEVLAGDTSTAREVLVFLPSWMVFHAATSDRFAQEHIAKADRRNLAEGDAPADEAQRSLKANDAKNNTDDAGWKHTLPA